MAAVISLREVVEAMDISSDYSISYLDPDTGEVITVMCRFKRPNATLAANSGFDQPSMIALASSRILEPGARLWKGCRQTVDYARNDSRPSHAQNWNRHRANDCVAMDPQVTTIRVAHGNQQIRLRLLRSLAQHLRHVTTADEYVRLDAHILLKLCEMLRSVADKRLFRLRNDVTAAGSPKLHRGSDVGERKTGTEFGGHLRGPRHSFVTTEAEIDRAQDVADRKLLHWRFFHVGAGPNRTLGPV